MAELIQTEVESGVATIWFNRADQLNAIDLDLAIAFDQAVHRVCADPTIRLIILRGRGRAFMAGGDLRYLIDAKDRAAAAEALIVAVNRAIQRLSESSKITVAAVHGVAAGAGMSIALSADLLVAAESARFQTAYLKVAGTLDCSGSWQLARSLGPRKALQLVLLGDSITAQQAQDMGIVARVLSDARLAEELDAVLHSLRRGPALALGLNKRLVRGALNRTLSEQLAAELESFSQAVADPDFSEGVAAFFERRAPMFGGRTDALERDKLDRAGRE